MKFIYLRNISILLAIIFCSFATIFSQVLPPEGKNFGERREPNPLSELGLTKEQMQQIRQLNRTHQPKRREVEMNMEKAKRDLDEVIYADETNDELVQQKLRAFMDAQAEVAKNRTLREMEMRKILTKEQLVKFREMRKSLMKTRPAVGFPPNRPFQNRRAKPGI